VVARRNFPKRNIFEQKTQKMLIICQIDWREVEWPLSCNAFAIARFLVFLLLSSLITGSAFCLSTALELGFTTTTITANLRCYRPTTTTTTTTTSNSDPSPPPPSELPPPLHIHHDHHQNYHRQFRPITTTTSIRIPLPQPTYHDHYQNYHHE